MAWIAREGCGYLWITTIKPLRAEDFQTWVTPADFHYFQKGDYIEPQWVKLPTDADEKLIGRHITWDDEPVEI